MRKYLLIAVAALVLLYPAVAWLMGVVVESRVHLAQQELFQRTPYLVLTEQKYHRGWYASEQDLTLAITSVPSTSPIAQAGLNFTVHNVIHHGPICGLSCIGIARVDSHVTGSDQLQAMVAKLYGQTEPLTIQSRVGFLGGGNISISSPALSDVALQSGGHFAWDGFRLTCDFSNQFDSMKVHGSLPHLVATGADKSRVELQALTLDLKNRRVLPLLYATDAVLAINRISISSPGAAAVSTIEQIRYAATSNTNAGFMDNGGKFDTGAISATNLNLKAAHIDLTLQHLQMQSLEALTKKIREVNQQTSTSPSQNIQALMEAIRGPLIDLLLAQPDIRLDQISLVTNGGQAVLTGVLALDNFAAADLAEGADPKALLRKLDANLELSVDDATIAELPGANAGSAQLQPLMQQGLIDHQNARWHTKIRYAQGQLTFNGKPFGAPPR